MIIFFQFHHFALNYFPLSFVVFSPFFHVWLFWEQADIVNLSWLSGFLTFFFYWTLVFLLSFLLKFFFFYLDFISWIVGSSSYLKLTQVFFFNDIFFVFIFDIKLLNFKLCNVFTFFTWILSISYLESYFN
jgi:hypothetical protein